MAGLALFVKRKTMEMREVRQPVSEMELVMYEKVGLIVGEV